MKHTESTETAIRMVGQLLLHHPTTGGMFLRTNGLLETPLFMGPKDLPKDACAFCYVGAINATRTALGFFKPYAEDLWSACDRAIGQPLDGDDWDMATPSQRTTWAKKLANYKAKK